MTFRSWATAVRALVLLSCVLAVAGTRGGEARAQVLVDSVHLSVPYHRQDTVVWCWVASAKMAAETVGLPTPSQCQMLELAYGAPCCRRPDLCLRPGHISEISRLVGMFGGRIGTLEISRWAPDFITHLRRTGRPIVAHVDGSHFVVITGMDVYQTPNGGWAVVSYHDPLVAPGMKQDWPLFAQRMSVVLAVR
ncbi:papain-like cysteine protease family protein [Salinarimonas chemoclinalis]|uniref:papain-like cysteine protease family protein n=1 Tax=Salinarimonas chemoclinalis TaxID=3241599 RepID=UPI003555CF3A